MKNNSQVSLFINTATYSIQFAICLNDEKFVVENPDNKQVLEQGNILIEKACLLAKVTLKDVDNFYTLLGPGSNTGIRLGLTIAKTIFAFNNKVKLYGINTLQLFSYTQGCPALSDRNSNIYTLDNSNVIKIKFDDLSSFIQNKDCFVIDRYDNKAQNGLKGAKKIKRINVIDKMIEFKDKFIDYSNDDENYLPIYQQQI